MQLRPTIAHIDLSAIGHNLRLIKTLAPGCIVCPVIKADAYGHGAVEVATFLQGLEDGPEWLAVSLIEEGIALRQSGIQCPILVLGGPDYGPAEVVRHRLTPTLWRVDQLITLDAAVGAADAAGARGFSFHLKIDTGMRRLGQPPAEVAAFCAALRGCPALFMEGLLSHFANADLGDREFNICQGDILAAVHRELGEYGFSPRWVHLANSAAVLTYPPARKSFVRPGLMLYGLDPRSSAGGVADTRLRPAMCWHTKPVSIVSVAAGERVSYGGTWIAQRPTRVAVLPLGYADGYPRLVSNRGQVLMRGQRVPLVGNICMDLMLADVGRFDGIAEETLRDEDVVLLGHQGEQWIAAEDIAVWAETISYEIVCGVGKRVPRTYGPAAPE